MLGHHQEPPIVGAESGTYRIAELLVTVPITTERSGDSHPLLLSAVADAGLWKQTLL